MEKKTKICPYCGEEIMASAIMCRYCGEWLINKPSNENNSVGEVPNKGSRFDGNSTEAITPDRPKYIGITLSQKENSSMSFVDAVKTCLRKWPIYEGRASRTEFWFFFLFDIICSFLIGIILYAVLLSDLNDNSTKFQFFFTMASMVTNFFIWLPFFSVATRRLHDVGLSGWVWLVNLIPLIGFLIFLYFLTKESTNYNKYGPNPNHTKIQKSNTTWKDMVIVLLIVVATIIFYVFGFVKANNLKQESDIDLTDYIFVNSDAYDNI